MNKLQENMRRFGTKNLPKMPLLESTLSDDDILDIILSYTKDPDLAEKQLMAYRETGEFTNVELKANILRDPRWKNTNNDGLTLAGLGKNGLEFTNVEDLKAAVDALPDEIEFISYPTELGPFDGSVRLKPKDDSNWKETVKSMLDNLSMDEDWDSYDSFKLKTYNGNPLRGVYIQIHSDKTRGFAAYMGSGGGGKLD